MKKLLDFLIVVLTAGITYLSAIAQIDWENDVIWPFKADSLLLSLLLKCKVVIFTITTILLISLYAFRIYRDKSDSEKYFARLFQHIVDKELGGEVYQTRVSLYIKKRGIKIIPTYLMSAFRYWHKPRYLLNLLYNIPNPFKNYLSLYVRHTYPKKETSMAYFRILEEGETENGVVEKCYKTGEVIAVDSDYIQDITLPHKFDLLTQNEKKKVKKYMKDTYIDDYSILKLMKRKSNQLYAFPIMRYGQIYGVIIIDKNDSSCGLKLKNIFSSNIDNYQKMIQIAIDSEK